MAGNIQTSCEYEFSCSEVMHRVPHGAFHSHDHRDASIL
jgi:hypothetical protein